MIYKITHKILNHKFTYYGKNLKIIKGNTIRITELDNIDCYIKIGLGDKNEKIKIKFIKENTKEN